MGSTYWCYDKDQSSNEHQLYGAWRVVIIQWMESTRFAVRFLIYKSGSWCLSTGVLYEDNSSSSSRNSSSNIANIKPSQYPESGGTDFRNH